MSWNVQGTRVSDMEKWELARRLSDNANAPTDTLKALFTVIMLGLEKKATTPFTSPIKDRVWDACSPHKINILKQTLASEVCSKILNNFNETAIHEMLVEHTSTGSIHNPLYGQLLEITYNTNKNTISTAVAQVAHSMSTDEWITEIFFALIKEGISFPEWPKK